MYFNLLAISSISYTSTYQYSLYWSGLTSTTHFDGQRNNSFLAVWESEYFAITATRLQEADSNIAALTSPPGQPGRFDGRLLSVSIYFKYLAASKYGNCKAKIVGAGLLSPQIPRGTGLLLESHTPLFSTKPGSFWEKENGQFLNAECDGNSKYLPGCLNSTDRPDNSSLTITFPVGVESRPHGFYSDGIFSLLLTRFIGDWDDYPEYNSSHQNFVLLLIRMLNFCLFVFFSLYLICFHFSLVCFIMYIIYVNIYLCIHFRKLNKEIRFI